jgi:hypothetical protein
MKHIDFKKMIGLLGFVLKCPICSVKYNLEHIKVLESEQSEHPEEARILVHSECERCKSSVMFNIDINGPEIFTIAMVTDLTSGDTAKFSKYQPISANDCIRIHETVRNFDGDFVKALSAR